MHQCSQIDEIIQRICEHLGDNTKRVRYRSLAGVARTCKSLNDPATDELWSWLDGEASIVPLLNAMAPDLWGFKDRKRVSEDGVETERVREALRAREITNQDIYALKLRASRVVYLDVFGVDQAAMAIAPVTYPIFPLCDSFEWRVTVSRTLFL
ncbi:hypothetical protein BKA70DRAFT_774106 [Coprinopsis sp. MPI-PUGE-AT-0042]|nr:hypothetical protein BKA70DRAFT_774106 [Coprinopsis sp. MPI-PUGE-AT-0042]